MYELNQISNTSYQTNNNIKKNKTTKLPMLISYPINQQLPPPTLQRLKIRMKMTIIPIIRFNPIKLILRNLMQGFTSEVYVGHLEDL